MITEAVEVGLRTAGSSPDVPDYVYHIQQMVVLEFQENEGNKPLFFINRSLLYSVYNNKS